MVDYEKVKGLKSKKFNSIFNDKYAEKFVERMKGDQTVPDVTGLISDMVLKADPTIDSRYFEWIAQSYIDGGIKFSDLSRGNENGVRHWLSIYECVVREHQLGRKHVIGGICGLYGCYPTIGLIKYLQDVHKNTVKKCDYAKDDGGWKFNDDAVKARILKITEQLEAADTDAKIDVMTSLFDYFVVQPSGRRYLNTNSAFKEVMKDKMVEVSVNKNIPYYDHFRELFDEELTDAARERGLTLHDQYGGDEVQPPQPLEVPEERDPSSFPFTFVTKHIKKFVGECQAVLGEGTYGRVCRTDRGFAVKEMRDDEIDSNVVIETSILRHLGVHPNILGIIAIQLQSEEDFIKKAIDSAPSFAPDNSLYIALPLAQASLVDITIDEKMRPFVYYQLLRALAYCHSHNVWHLDMKPDNVLVFEPAFASSQIPIRVKIADFGLSRTKANERKMYTTYVCSMWYRAPELYLYEQGQGYYSGKVDVWSIGVMLYDDALLSTKKSRFHKDTELGIQNACLDILGNPPAESHYTKAWVAQRAKFNSKDAEKERKRDESFLNDLMSNSVEEALLLKIFQWPEKRLTAYECLQEPYFEAVRHIIESEMPSPHIFTSKCTSSVIGPFDKLDKEFVQRCFELDNVKRIQSEELPADECGWAKLRARDGDKTTLNRRRTCYKWLEEVRVKFKHSRSVIFYAMALMDYIADKLADKMSTRTLQMYSCACFLISSYLQESYSPDYRDFVYISDNAFNVGAFKQAIIDVLTATEFNLLFPSAWDFVYHSYCDMFLCQLTFEQEQVSLLKKDIGNTLSELAVIMFNMMLDDGNVGEMSQSDYAMEALKRLSEKDVKHFVLKIEKEVTHSAPKETQAKETQAKPDGRVLDKKDSISRAASFDIDKVIYEMD